MPSFFKGQVINIYQLLFPKGFPYLVAMLLVFARVALQFFLIPFEAFFFDNFLLKCWFSENQNESPSEILLMDVTGGRIGGIKESVAKKSQMYFMNFKTTSGRVQ